MKVKIWGCRGSITTPGMDTNRYGGNSTCLEIRSDDGRVFVVDAGSGLRNFGKTLRYEPAVSEIRFFFTHSHWDHLVGFPFFEPVYSNRYMITLCNGPHGEGVLQQYLSRQMEAPYFPIDFSNLKATFNFGCETERKESGYCPLGSFRCTAFPLSHPNGGHGFKFMDNGKTFVFLTDNELGFQHQGGLTRDEYVKLCEGADLLLHDAQYTDEEYKCRRGWGHSTYRDAVGLAIEADVKRLGLFHHDPDRTDADLDRQAQLCRTQISRPGAPWNALHAKS
jgi:phosphoribosyl 1,2-cyclic phosphodiesterase